MDKFLHLGMMKNPFNWLILYLMVATGMLAVKLIFGKPAETTTAA